MLIDYQPQGVCSRRMLIQVEDGVVQDLQVIGGCHGNLQGISALVRGMKVEDVVARLSGIRCGVKPTSCPDQLSKALEQAMHGAEDAQ
ncbi:TIGR03905 family protein [Flavonifractor sp. An92]|uniref:TIGR03905 family TSCPD domain-containing protein n=1 Tax=Flavonifractor sp. An92 TaxID=1965666 RepID=UPI000B3AB9E5|nr:MULTISPECIES: TIGR03905 family TSCPD domain-containing protein [unclassified Flavonifractor]OUN07154.1 TIGR03905 family protein [Flavonifractor sp. An92]OUQ18424.1 TIGR03905 family protein [Flavonifractor sp. An135]